MFLLFVLRSHPHCAEKKEERISFETWNISKLLCKPSLVYRAGRLSLYPSITARLLVQRTDKALIQTIEPV